MIKIVKIIIILEILVMIISPVYAEDPSVDSSIEDNGIHNGVYSEISNEINGTLDNITNDIELLTNKVFNPVFSEITNLTVTPEIKLIYHLELPANTSIYNDSAVMLQPIFDLRVEQPVEFKIYDHRVLIGNEYIIDYKQVMDQITPEKEVFPPMEVEIQSEINSSKIYDLKVIPDVNSAIFKFIYREKEVQIPVYSDFKIENKKLYLIHNNKPYGLRVTPPEIYSAVYNAVEKNPEILVKSLVLKVENEKPVYDLKVEEPFKLLWIIPMKIESRYVIDPTDGNASEKEKPWYTFLGKVGCPIDTYNVVTN